MLEQALASELFCLEGCIVELLDYIHQQGELDIWLTLMNYRNEKLGYATGGHFDL